MKYVFNTENYHNFDMIRDNVLPPRSYFIPFGSKEKMEGIVTAEKRYRSDKVEVLNGEWDFRFFRDPKEMPAVFDTNDMTVLYISADKDETDAFTSDFDGMFKLKA